MYMSHLAPHGATLNETDSTTHENRYLLLALRNGTDGVFGRSISAACALNHVSHEGGLKRALG